MFIVLGVHNFARGANLTTALSFPLFVESLEAVIDVLCFAENDCPSSPLLRLALSSQVGVPLIYSVYIKR